MNLNLSSQPIGYLFNSSIRLIFLAASEGKTDLIIKNGMIARRGGGGLEMKIFFELFLR